MIREETLKQVEGQRTFEEPDGEFLELVSSNNNTITVLTRVETDTENPAPFDPGDYTVSELDDWMAGQSFSESQIQALHVAERDGKNRVTARELIRDAGETNA
jgi:hypothetical protein